MKKRHITLFLAFVLCFSLFAVGVSAVSYNGTATPLMETTTGEYGKLIWKQDFEGAASIGDYRYDIGYVSPYAADGATLSDTSLVWTGDGDGTNPTFTIVDNPVGDGKVLSMLGKTTWPIYQLHFGKEKDIISKPGKYTLVVHAYDGGKGYAANCRFLINRCYEGAPEAGSISFGSNAFNKNAFSFTICTKEEFKATGLTETSYTNSNVFALQYVYLFMMGGNGKTCYFDNIELWYDEYADITFHTEAKNDGMAKDLEMLFPNTHKSYLPGTALPKLSVPGSGYRFVGWSKVKDDASQIVTEAEAGLYNLYAIYEDANGDDLAGLETYMTPYEMILLSARLHAVLSGKTAEIPESAAFADYLAYAEKYSLLPTSGFGDYTRAITRGEAAEMFYNALPADGLTAINTIKSIPDIEDYQGFYEAVYALYRSGILGGVNKRGAFRPYEALLRCDYETLASRVADPEERVRQTLEEAVLDKAGTIQLEKNTQKTFDAAFISAPESYLATLEEMPSYTLPLGDWIGPTEYTRYYLQRKINISKTVSKAEIEFQSSLPIDLFIGNTQIPTEKVNGWHLTGVKDVTSALASGTNFINVRGFLSDNTMHFLAGVRGCLSVTYTDGTTENFDTSNGFTNSAMGGFWANSEQEGWQTTTLSGTRRIHKTKLHPRLRTRAMYMRSGFLAEKEIEKATLYATAQGLYVPYLNGERVTDARFLPGSMQYLTEYQVFDVTEFVHTGKNIIGAELASGFNNSESWGAFYNNIPSLMMQLEIEYTDGTSLVIGTNKNWQVTASPRVENDIQFGERYDARLETADWCSDLNAGSWASAEEHSVTGKTRSQEHYEPVRINNEMTAKTIFTLADGSTCYDFGLNSTGRVKLILRNTKPGEQILIRYCESLNGSETLGYTANVSEYGDVYFYKDTYADGRACYGARNLDTYICKGAEEEVYIPEFTFTGFRYIYVSGYSGTYDISTVKKVEMYNDLDVTGDFETSHAGLAKVWDAVKRSYRSNIVTGPMDCPTREKNFWNGDMQVFINTACWYMDNNRFLERWTESGRKMGGDYTYGWGDEDYIVPLTLYKFYGNTDVIASKYAKIKTLINYRRNQVASGDVLPSKGTYTYGDHQAPSRVSDEFFCNVYYTLMYKRAAEMAEILGKTDEAAGYLAEYEKARVAFNNKYYLAGENDYSSKNQSGLVYALAFEFAEPENREALAAKLHEYVAASGYHFTTSFMSTEYILSVLCDYGYEDDAYRLVTQTTYPSLINMVETSGGGTVTESWKGTVGTGDSINHYSIGNAARWFFEYLGGIKVAKPGFDEITVKPYFFKDLKDIDVTYKSAHGLIESAWSYQKNDKTFIWNVTIPNGITATLALPESMKRESGDNLGTVGSGSYTIVVAENKAPDTRPVLIYADGESGKGSLIGHGNFNIIADPSDKDNLCYSNIPKNDDETWLYLQHPVTYKPGYTYSVECDVMIASSGTTNVIGQNFKAEILCNVPYADSTGAKKDHVVARTGKISANGQWTHWAFEFTIPEDSTERKYDMFSFYTDPVGEKGVGYLFDNLIVRENPLPDTRKIVFQADADNTTFDFYGWKSVTSIAADPNNEVNKCYKTLPENDTESIYTSSTCRITVKPGYTYSVDCDVMLASSGTSEAIDSGFTGVVQFNMQYKDAGGTNRDHVVGSSGKIAANGEWKHVSFDFTVAADATESATDQFILYSNPVGGKGVGFRFDNLIVRENEPTDSDSAINSDLIA